MATEHRKRRKAARQRRKEWLKLKHEIYGRDGWRCRYCGRKVHTQVPECAPVKATVDHDVPRSKGGKSNPDNLVTACRSCNQYKGDMTGDEFRHQLRLLAIETVVSELKAKRGGEDADYPQAVVPPYRPQAGSGEGRGDGLGEAPGGGLGEVCAERSRGEVLAV